MQEIKIRYILKDTENGNIFSEFYTLEQLEMGDLTWAHFKNQVIEVIARNLFTGLKDKNGVDIYEGDVVVVCNWGYDLKNYGRAEFDYCYDKKKVFFDNGSFIIDGEYSNNLYNRNCRIIGNIYENPELLK